MKTRAEITIRDAAEATLLFHSAETWTAEKTLRWVRLTGTTAATTKALCDTVRAGIENAEAALARSRL